MIKKLINFLGTIIILIVLLVMLGWRDSNLRYASYFQTDLNAEKQQINTASSYFNSRFNYEIRYKDPWRIKSNYSLEMAMMKLTEEFSLRELEKCIRFNECKEELEIKLQNFRREWKEDKSEIIILTDLCERGRIDQAFIDFGFKKDSMMNLPKGCWIQIFPTGIDSDLEKERLEGRIKLKIITLQNGLKAQQQDSRALDGGRVNVLVPYNFDAKLDSGEQAKSLNFITDAEAGSDSEKTFYEIVNFLSFNEKNEN